MKRIIIICIFISLLGGIYIYAQTTKANYEREANLVSTVFDSAIFEMDVSIWQDCFVEEFVKVSQNKYQNDPRNKSEIDEFAAEETVIETPFSEMSDEEMELIKSEADSFLSSAIVSDFLAMDSENFEDKYDRIQLYKDDILYCDMNSWQYHGTQLDPYSNPEDYYDVINITSLRYLLDDQLYDFVEENYTDTNTFGNSNSTNNVYIQYMENYAISMYFQGDIDTEKEDAIKLLEISFVKVELEEGEAPESLYRFLEDNYYEIRESILSENWIVSPEGNKEICVINGALPRHPAQIFVRCREKTPDSIFRFTWEQGIVGWIDEEHAVCNTLGWTPKLIHIETSQIENIEMDTHAYDPAGAKYEIDEEQLIVTTWEEKNYHWNIVKENNEVYITKENDDV